jgi:hypothetical protein
LCSFNKQSLLKNFPGKRNAFAVPNVASWHIACIQIVSVLRICRRDAQGRVPALEQGELPGGILTKGNGAP